MASVNLEKPAVLILGKLPPPYFGPAVATQILLKSKLRDHFTLHHLCTNINEQMKEMASFQVKKPIQIAKLYLKLIFILIAHRIDIVLIPISQTSWGFYKDSPFILISKLLGKKVIVQLRGSNFANWVDRSSKLNRKYVKFVLKRSEGVIVLGQKLRGIFKDYYSDDRIFVVPNGANYLTSPIARTPGELTLLYLSNLQPAKGIEDFLSSLIQLEKKEKKYIAMVAGIWLDEKTKQNCERIVKVNKLKVKFLPPANPENKTNLFQQADIFIFPPRMPEGHPWVIVEAMAAGLPIISTDQGAITESVQDNVNGFIVDAKSPTQISEKIMCLIENPALKQKMGQASREAYLEKYTEDKMVEKLKFVFEEILGIENGIRK